MSESNKSYRIHTKIDNGQEFLNISTNLVQDYDILEVLSLKIGTENVYKLHTSNYGCVVGRVLANGGVGVPNAKISIFIEQAEETSEDAILSYLYPYKSVRSKNSDGIRYNLLPEEQLFDCHRNVGGFPDKRLVLDDDNVLEIYDKYYKFTTRTNNAGDYLIFGVPTGDQMIHMDVDLSDIGILSQKPRDMIYKGYNITQFENANMFKKDTNLDSLTQVITQNSNVHVYPFWGESNIEDIKITRHDINLDYKFETTCVFMGSILTDDKDNGFTKKCFPTKDMGSMKKLITGEGTIEMIRKTLDGSVEAITIQGNQLIDGNGVWCYQIPMNLDYVYTDEVGNLVPTTDTSKGIPTRARVRFRFSLNDFASDYQNNHLTKLLVPHNPSNEKELDYAFGSSTNDKADGTGSFRDLLWDNVYSVKSYIPRLQGNSLGLSHSRDTRFSGFKNINAAQNVNHIPYNNLRVNITFKFLMQCFLFHSLILIVGGYNKMVKRLYNGLINIPLVKNLVKNLSCLYIGGGSCEGLDNWYFAPNCEGKIANKTYDDLTKEQETIEVYDESGRTESYLPLTNNDGQDKASNDYNNGGKVAQGVCLASKVDYFVKCTEISMAMEEEIIQFDFYNDWINGLLYIPRWFATIRPKKSFFFGLFKREESIQACLQDNNVNKVMVIGQQCAPTYDIRNDGMKIVSPIGCGKTQNCHKAGGFKSVKLNYSTGFVKQYQTETNTLAKAYYPLAVTSVNGRNAKLFATDIILLGSLNKTNMYGIPQTFKNLPTSTYQLPPNVAITTLYGDTYVYQGDGATICQNGELTDGIKEMTPTAEAVGASPEFTDETEYPVVEMAGIDWTFDGPNQNKDKDKVFYPSGHFIGMGCTHSQANIKTCVNLSRACEAGSMLSQRQSFIQKIEGGKEKYAYLHPTGLISYDEINDGGLRSEFASMNYNVLKTKEKNGIRGYDFASINPTGFGGEMRNYTSSPTPYNSEWFNENIGSDAETNPVSAATRTIEKGDKEYLNYRFGGEIGIKNFLHSTIAIPVFENSYYFYFGKEEGNTSLNKLYKDYFAECPELNPYIPHITIEITEADSCSNNPDGKINVKFHNINGSGTVKCGVETIHFTEDQGSVEFTGLVGNENYEITVTGDLFVEIKQNVFLPFKNNGVEILIETVPFGKEVRFSNDSSGKKKFEDYPISEGDIGSVRLTIEGDNVLAWGIFNTNPNDERYGIQFKEGISSDTQDGVIIYLREKTERSLISEDKWLSKTNSDRYNLYVWSGGSDYTAFVVYQCNDSYGSVLNDTGVIYMPKDFNLYFGDDYNVLDHYAGAGGMSDLSNISWVKSAMTVDTPQKARLSFLKALSYTWAFPYKTMNGQIIVAPDGLYEKYSLTGYTGSKSIVREHTENSDSSYKKYREGVINDVVAPCYGIVLNSPSTVKQEWDFEWEYKNGDALTTATTVIPYFYLPFFTNLVCVHTDIKSNGDKAENLSRYVRMGIVNGAVDDNEKYGYVSFNNEDIDSDFVYHQRNGEIGMDVDMPKSINLDMPKTGDSKYYTFSTFEKEYTGSSFDYHLEINDWNNNNINPQNWLSDDKFFSFGNDTDLSKVLGEIKDGRIVYYKTANTSLIQSIYIKNILAIGNYVGDTDHTWRHVTEHSDELSVEYEYADFNLNMIDKWGNRHYVYTDIGGGYWIEQGGICKYILGVKELEKTYYSDNNNLVSLKLYDKDSFVRRLDDLAIRNDNLKIKIGQYNLQIQETYEIYVILRLKEDRSTGEYYIHFSAIANPNRWPDKYAEFNINMEIGDGEWKIINGEDNEWRHFEVESTSAITVGWNDIEYQREQEFCKLCVRNRNGSGTKRGIKINADSLSSTRWYSSYVELIPNSNYYRMVKIKWYIPEEKPSSTPSDYNKIWYYLDYNDAVPETNYENTNYEK